MRLLHLTTEFPWPRTSGGPVRTLAQLKLLASLPEVDGITLLSVTERPVTPGERAALAAAVPKLHVVPPVFHPIHLWQHPRRVPRVLALRSLGVPYVAAKWDSRALRRALCRELRRSPADVVYVDHLGMARYLPEIRAARPAARVVLEEHNVESALFEGFAGRVDGLRRRIARAEWRAAARFETRALRSVDAVVAISGADARHLARLADVTAHVVPVVMEFEPRCRPPVSAPRFCWVGTLGWHPNVAGLDWLCREAWPRIRARVPDATLEIAGPGLLRHRNGTLAVPEAWKVPGVSTIGFVDDIEPLYARSLAMLAPVRGDGGVRIKVLDGMRVGLPVVTTSDGVSGIPLTDGKEVLIADAPDAFAERVERLVRSPDLRARLRDAAYAYLRAYHSAEVAQVPLRRALGIGSS